VRAFDHCDTQWRVGFATTGLDYAACIAALTLYLPYWQAEAPADDPIHHCTVASLMDDVRTIERAMLDAWAERDKAERERQSVPGADA
jgi:hypothetical protein